MRTTYLSDAFFNHVYRNTALSSPGTVYAGLLTAVAGAEAGSVTEANYTGYARVAVTFGAPGAGGNGRQITNSAVVTFGLKTDAGTQDMIAVGIFDALTNGNLLDIIYLDDSAPFVVILNDETADTFEHDAHGLADDDQVRLDATVGSGGLPTGVSENTTYHVVNATADDFQLSATQGGAAVAITAGGEAMVQPLLAVSIAQNATPEFAASSLTLQDD